jgi:hypothetical protein
MIHNLLVSLSWGSTAWFVSCRMLWINPIRIILFLISFTLINYSYITVQLVCVPLAPLYKMVLNGCENFSVFTLLSDKRRQCMCNAGRSARPKQYALEVRYMYAGAD